MYNIIKTGDWIFTCSMLPQQFDTILVKKDAEKNWNKTNFTEEAWKAFLHDDFQTLNGSHHSFKNCGCRPVSEAYAKWFLANNVHLLYEEYNDETNTEPWIKYEAKIRELCLRDKIEYEGF